MDRKGRADRLIAAHQPRYPARLLLPPSKLQATLHDARLQLDEIKPSGRLHPSPHTRLRTFVGDARPSRNEGSPFGMVGAASIQLLVKRISLKPVAVRREYWLRDGAGGSSRVLRASATVDGIDHHSGTSQKPSCPEAAAPSHHKRGHAQPAVQYAGAAECQVLINAGQD